METWQDEYNVHEMQRDGFEGWYFRISDAQFSLAVIFGISNAQEDAHAFIQTIDTITKKTQYIRYPLENLVVQKEPFLLTLDKSFVSLDRMRVCLDDAMIPIHIDVTFSSFQPLTKSTYAPTIMGPFAYIKNMECVHSVISLHHDVVGELSIDGQVIQLQGKGYIEKDRGTSFPKQYVWLQSNACKEMDATFFLAIATIPLHMVQFQGIISVLSVNQKQYRFATYYGAYAKRIPRPYGYDIVLYQGSYRLFIKVEQGERYPLLAPLNGNMGPKVYEGLNGVITLRMFHYKTCILHLHFLQCGNELRE